MKKIFFLLIALLSLCDFGFSQQNKIKHKTTRVLGYAYNYGTGEVEIGGKSLDIDKKTIGPGDKIYFELVSGKMHKVSVVAVNKYDVWTNVINNGKDETQYVYTSYFKKFYKSDDFKSYKVFVNGSHNQYEKEACIIRILLISEEKVTEKDYKFVLELKPPNYTESYKGIATDGVSTLRMDFYYPGNTSLQIRVPKCGTFARANRNTIRAGNASINLDESGHGYLLYTPPKYIDQEWWEELVNESNFTPEMGMLNNISKIYVDLKLPIVYKGAVHIGGGKLVNDTCIIKLYRPPILFVHGFLGSGATWAGMSQEINNLGFSTTSRNYFVGDGSIGDQSEKLSLDVKGTIIDFTRKGIKITKVDIVAHSMGGLISRYFLQSELYNDNVRKLITVGTPHHGVSSIGFYIGRMGTAWYELHEKAVYELRENSDFLKDLNASETSGRHLVEGVEYGNIYVNPSDYVVSASSARLNMVPSAIMYSMSHSTDISKNSITSHPSVQNQIVLWMGAKIERTPNIYLNARLSGASKGEVYRTYFPRNSYTLKEEKINKFPCKFELYHSLKTGDGKAILHLKAGNRVWGSVFLYANSEIHIGNASPDLMEIRLLKGKAQFKSIKATGGHFIVHIHDEDSPYCENGNFTFNPKATVLGLDTEFAIEYVDGEIFVVGLEGDMEVYTKFEPGVEPVLLSESQSVVIRDDVIDELQFKEPDWIIDLDDVIEEETQEEDSKTDVNNDDENSDEDEESGILYILIGLVVVLIPVIIVIIIIILVVKSVNKNKNKK